MKLIYLDTETTGLKIGRMFQLAYILLEKGKATGKNFFFALPPGSMTFEALYNHGVSDQQTVKLSKGKKFADHWDEIRSDFEGTPERKTHLIAHNMKFDSGFIENEIKLAGLLPLKNVVKNCTVEYFTPILQIPSHRKAHKYKYPSLRELVQTYKITDREATQRASEIFKCKSKLVKFHDARYDVTMLFLCCRQYAGDGRILQKAIRNSIIKVIEQETERENGKDL